MPPPLSLASRSRIAIFLVSRRDIRTQNRNGESILGRARVAGEERKKRRTTVRRQQQQQRWFNFNPRGEGGWGGGGGGEGGGEAQAFARSCASLPPLLLYNRDATVIRGAREREVRSLSLSLCLSLCLSLSLSLLLSIPLSIPTSFRGGKFFRYCEARSRRLACRNPLSSRGGGPSSVDALSYMCMCMCMWRVYPRVYTCVRVCIYTYTLSACTRAFALARAPRVNAR